MARVASWHRMKLIHIQCHSKWCLKHSTSSPHCKQEWKTHTPCSCTFSSCFLGHSAICWAIKSVTTDNLSAYEKPQLGKGLAAHGVLHISWKCLPYHGYFRITSDGDNASFNIWYPTAPPEGDRTCCKDSDCCMACLIPNTKLFS